MDKIIKITFLKGPIASGFAHVSENNGSSEITLITDENGNELTYWESWTIPDGEDYIIVPPRSEV